MNSVSHRIVCLADPETRATLFTMNPVEPDRSQRRIALYFVAVLAVILAPLFFVFWLYRQAPSGADDFARWMNTGKSYYEQGEATNAVAAFQKAVALQPTQADPLLNLANACLLAGQSDNALKFAKQVLSLDPDSAAAYHIGGCANMRLGKFEAAIQLLQQAKDIDPKVNAVSLQLGRAHLELQHYQEAADQFSEIIQFAPDYPFANFFLGQALLRLGRQEEARMASVRVERVDANQQRASVVQHADLGPLRRRRGPRSACCTTDARC